MTSDVVYATSDQVLAGFVRLVTNARIFAEPTRLAEAFDFADWLREQPNCRVVRAGERHWFLFRSLCVGSGVKGGRVTDAWFAALALEHGCIWITADRDFARYPGLLWRHPLDDATIRENPR